MTKELKDQRIAVMLTPSELEAVDDWSFAHRIRSRGEAIRQLLLAGLATQNAVESGNMEKSIYEQFIEDYLSDKK
ncbi:hypothetical protein [Ochrobactrum sp. Marseille-Q0166]|uniref:hypothetical protein n=1 Tax=Ochrobactrum sp. Marseille-Q0166 TaxID=2761105 RepID=UPI0016553ED8|nr:hypothetical protein [Ochrobactrum sp. Marseille-Q0166]MBC8719310.1 hypothetical protein [Ochrobactrum sp. Marseille-Q0166]